ncbi:MAG: hypothetical protein ACLRZ7_00780 [Lachnospiraceae bacterium]
MKAVLNVKSMKKLIDATKKFVSNIEGNKLMTFIKISVSDNQITAMALDGHKISLEKAECNNDETFECYIKPVLPVTKGCDECEIELIDDYAYITAGDNRVGFKQPEGEFYKVDNYLDPKQYDHFCICVNATMLKQALESIKNPMSNGIVLRFKNPTAPIYIENAGSTITSQRIVFPLRCDSALERYNRN